MTKMSPKNGNVFPLGFEKVSRLRNLFKLIHVSAKTSENAALPMPGQYLAL